MNDIETEEKSITLRYNDPDKVSNGKISRTKKFSKKVGAISTRRAGKLYKARSRLYRNQILQVNTRWKALAEIYTMRSLAPLWNRIPKNEENHGGIHRSLISNFSLKIAEFLPDFIQNFAILAKMLLNFRQI